MFPGELEAGSIAMVGLPEVTLGEDNKVLLLGGNGSGGVCKEGSMVESVDTGLVFWVEAEARYVLGGGGGERGTPVEEVRRWVATAVVVEEEA